MSYLAPVQIPFLILGPTTPFLSSSASVNSLPQCAGVTASRPWEKHASDPRVPAARIEFDAKVYASAVMK